MAAIGAATVFAASPAEAAELDYEDASAAEIEDHIEELEADRDEAAGQLSGYQEQLAGAQAVIEEAAASYGTTEAQLDQVTLVVDSAERDLGAKMTSLVDFAREQSAQYDQAQEAQEQVELLEGEIERTEATVADLDEQIDEAEQAAEEAAEAEAEAAAEAAAEAEAEAESQSDSSDSDGGSQTAAYNSDAATAAVEFARDQLGEAYVYGSAGPDTWDCSGLVKGAYAVSGITLTHQTNAIWAETSEIGRDDLRAGDLVFYNGLGHMAIYIGGGQVIHAPSSGDVVKTSDIDMMGIDGYRRV